MDFELRAEACTLCGGADYTVYVEDGKDDLSSKCLGCGTIYPA